MKPTKQANHFFVADISLVEELLPNAFYYEPIGANKFRQYVTDKDGFIRQQEGDPAVVEWNEIENKPSTFSPSTHTHEISEVNQLPETIQSILDAIAVSPTYVAPTASLTNVTQSYEIGHLISSLSLSLIFNQNDAGSANAFAITQNGNLIASTQSTVVSNIIVPLGNTIFAGSVSYNDGPIKNNNLNIPDENGRILAGTVNAPNRTVTGRYRQFFGNTVEQPSDSSGVRALPQNNLDNVNTLDLTTGTTNIVFAIAIHQSKFVSQVIDLGNLNVNITSEYVLVDSAFQVNDAAGNPQTYKLYVMSIAIPYSVSTTHRITLVNA